MSTNAQRRRQRRQKLQDKTTPLSLSPSPSPLPKTKVCEMYSGTIDPDVTDYYYHPKSQCNITLVLKTHTFHFPGYLLFVQSRWARVYFESFPNTSEIVFSVEFKWSPHELAEFLCALEPGRNLSFPFFKVTGGEDPWHSYNMPSYARTCSMVRLEKMIDDHESALDFTSEQLARLTFKENSNNYNSPRGMFVDWVTLQICHWFDCHELLLSARTTILSARSHSYDRPIEFILSCAVESKKRELTAIFPPVMFLRQIYSGIQPDDVVFTVDQREIIQTEHLHKDLFDARYTLTPTMVSLTSFARVFDS